MSLSEKLGSLEGMGNSLNSVARFLTPLLSGLLTQHMGYSAPAVASALLCTISCVMLQYMITVSGPSRDEDDVAAKKIK